MLSGSALIRVAILVAVAAMLAALVQTFWSYSQTEPESEGRAASPPTVSSGVATAQEPVRQTPAPPAAPSPPAPPSDPVPTPPPPPVQPAEPRPAVAAPPADLPPASRAGGAGAADPPAPAALPVVDLNTGTLAELNALQGGGAIGKAIIRGRPYASVDQLLSKRVLSRSTYQRVKDQVSVR